MTEKTWVLLIICVTIICLASIAADCYKACKQNWEQKRERGRRPVTPPPHKGTKEDQNEQK